MACSPLLTMVRIRTSRTGWATRARKSRVVGSGIHHRGKPLVLQQIEQVLGVAAVGLRFADHHGPNLGGLPNQQGVSQLLHDRVKPERVAGRFGKRQLVSNPNSAMGRTPNGGGAAPPRTARLRPASG